MTKPNPQPEKPKAPLRFSQEQYDMLKRCSDKKDMTEWNEWRKDHPDENVWLQGRSFKDYWLEEVNFAGEIVWRQADGKELNFTGQIHLERTRFDGAYLERATFTRFCLKTQF